MNKQNGHSEYGKLLSKPDISEIKEKHLVLVIVGLVIGVVYLGFAKLLPDELSGPIEIRFMFIASTIAAFSMLFVSTLSLYKYANLRLEFYEHWYIDHYCTIGKKLEGPVEYYSVENELLFGVRKNGEKILILNGKENAIIQNIFYQVIGDLGYGKE